MKKTKLTGEGLVSFAKSKLGTPYFYGSKIQYGALTKSFMKQMHKYYPRIVTLLYMEKAKRKKQVGKVNVDCSGLIYGYTGKNLCSAQLYSTAKKRMKIKDVKKFPIGTTLWKEGHVGVYIGMENGVPMCIEAKGIAYGTVKTKVSSTKWKYGLILPNLSYTTNRVSGNSKSKNTYSEPILNLKKGAKGEYVKWLQYELIESGYKISIDGVFGKKTLNALKSFQKSAKLVVDGVCGIKTREALLAK